MIKLAHMEKVSLLLGYTNKVTCIVHQNENAWEVIINGMAAFYAEITKNSLRK